MPNTEIVVVENKNLSLKDEARVVCKQYATDCLKSAKAPAKQLASSFIDRAVDYLIFYVQQKFAA